MIQVVCDNCQMVLKDKPDHVGAEPEPHCVLKLECGVKNLIMMDLCLRCAKKYLGVLTDPV
jgi:hypothetical protein